MQLSILVVYILMVMVSRLTESQSNATFRGYTLTCFRRLSFVRCDVNFINGLAPPQSRSSRSLTESIVENILEQCKLQQRKNAHFVHLTHKIQSSNYLVQTNQLLISFSTLNLLINIKEVSL